MFCRTLVPRWANFAPLTVVLVIAGVLTLTLVGSGNVAYAQTEVPVAIPVEIVGPRFLSSDLRSQTFTLEAPAGGQASQTIHFNDPQVTLHDISSAGTNSLKSGRCQTLISINEILVKILKWEPPSAIVEVKEGPGGLVLEATLGSGIAGQWEPPGDMPRIALSPNDSVTIQVESVNTKKNDKGSCEAQFVVLATVPNS